jgi:glycosyltransferase involved in cell wall biosynthesis
MKQVAFIAEGYPGTGFGNYWRPLFEQFKKDKNIIPVYIQYARETDEIKDSINGLIWDFRRPTRNRKFNRVFLQMCGGYPVKYKMKPFDIVHLATDWMSFMVPDFNKKKVIITCHDLFTFDQVVKKRFDFSRGAADNIKRLLNYHSQIILKKADVIIAISENTKKDIIRQFNIPGEKIRVVYNGIDSSCFKPRNKYQCRRALGLWPDKFILLNIGTENERKNIKTLLKAMKIISQTHKDVVLVRIGKQSESSRKYIHENKLADFVQYFTRVEQIELFYNAADVFVFPSVYEGFGLVALEAMASGCPVITTDKSAIPEVTGSAAVLLSDPLDPEVFYQAIKTMYESESFRESLVFRGLERSRLFSWEKCAAEMRSIYNVL